MVMKLHNRYAKRRVVALTRLIQWLNTDRDDDCDILQPVKTTLAILRTSEDEHFHSISAINGDRMTQPRPSVRVVDSKLIFAYRPEAGITPAQDSEEVAGGESANTTVPDRTSKMAYLARIPLLD